MTRALRTLVVLSVLAATSSAFAGTAQAATAFDGKRCTIVGTARADIIHGTAGNDVICGLGGDDHLYGMGGNDVLDGGYGWDWLWGGSGTDVLSGGPDYDTVWYDDHPRGVRVVMDGKPDSGTGAEHDTIGGTVENVVGSDHNDTIIGSAVSRNLLFGGLGDDLFSTPSSGENRSGGDDVFGEGGVDRVTYAWSKGSVNVSLDERTNDGPLEGYKDNIHSDVEIVEGGQGNDVLHGNKYSKELVGGAGNDRLIGDGGPDYLYGGVGIDTADYGTRTSGVSVTMNDKDDDGAPGEKDYVAPDNEKVILGSGNDVFHGATLPMTVDAGPGNDILFGGSGADGFYGREGNDHLIGGAGSDKLDAGPGNNVVEGGDGNDLLTGNLGKNVLRGGAGDDILKAGSSDDQLFGDDGTDRLHSAGGDDQMDGGAGVNACDTTPHDVAVNCQVGGPTGYMPGDGATLVSGTLKDADGSPVPGATVFGGDYGHTATTAADGGFAVAGPTLRVNVPAGNGMTLSFYGGGLTGGGSRVLALQLPVVTDEVVTVTDTHGTPVPGAALHSTSSFGTYPFDSVTLDPTLSPFTAVVEGTPTTAADGTLVLPSLPGTQPSMYVDIDDPKAGYQRDDASSDTSRVLDLTPVHLDLTFQDAHGNPLSGVTFSDVLGNGTYYDPEKTYGAATSGADGKVVVDVPKKKGRWHATIGGTTLASDVDLSSGGDRTLALVVPDAVPRTIHVKDQNGEPVSGAVVGLGQPSVLVSLSPDVPAFTGTLASLGPQITDSGGDVTITTLPIKGVLGASYSSPETGNRWTNQLYDLTGASTEVTFDLTTVLPAGDVVDGSGDPVPGVTVNAGYGEPFFDQQATAADGTFQLHLPPGQVPVFVSGLGVAGMPYKFAFSADSVALPLTGTRFVLAPVALHFHVVDSAGKPVSGVAITGGPTAITPVAVRTGGPLVYGSQSLANVTTDASGNATAYAFRGQFSTIAASLGSRVKHAFNVNVAGAPLSITLALPD